MSRELRRLLIEPDRLAGDGGGGLELRPPERHYLERVLRFRVGERLAVVDGAGRLWTAVLAEGGRLRLEQDPAAPLEVSAAPTPQLELAMALPKREAELVWRMATELGADRLQPLLAQRSVAAGSPPRQRWGAVVREASEQCERLWLPELAEPAQAETWLALPPPGLGLLATTRRPGLPSPGAALAESLGAALGAAVGAALGAGPAEPGGRGAADLAIGRISLAIGPEGGWTEAEERAAETAGWIPVSLGATILRTATAAVAGMAALVSWREISSSSFPGPSS